MANLNIFSKSFWEAKPDKVRVRDVLREATNLVAEAPIKAGQYTSTAIAGRSIAKQQAEAEARQLQMNQTIFQKMRENRDAGKSNGNLIKLLKDQQSMPAPTVDDILPRLKDTNKQVVGAFAGTALDMIGVGKVYSTAKALKTASALNKSGVPVTGTKGILKTGAKELAQTLPVGYGMDVSRRLMSGQEGKEAFKPGLATAFSAALPIAGTSVALYNANRANDIAKLMRYGYSMDDARKIAPKVGLPETPKLKELGIKMNSLSDQINDSTNPAFVERATKTLSGLKKQFQDTLGMELQAGKVSIGRGAGEIPTTVPASKLPTPDEFAAAAQKPVAERAGNIRLDKLDISDESKDLVRKIVKENQEFIKQRRGRMSWEETQELADNIIPKSRLKKGTTLNAEEMVSLGDSAVSTLRRVEELGKKIAAGDDSSKTLLEMKKLQLEAAHILNSFSGARAESGRSLQILRKINKALESNDAKLMKQALKLAGDKETAQDILNKLDTFGDDTLGKIRFLRNVSNVKFRDKVYEVWLNSILSGPVTQMANTTGNTLMAMTRPVTRAVQSGISKQVYFREAPEMVVGALSGFQDGIRKAAFVFKNGIDMDDFSKIELGRLPAIKGAKGEVVRVPTKILSAVDEFFKTIVHSSESRALAYRQARQEGLKGQQALERMYEVLENPSLELVDAASKAAEAATFQAPLGKFGSAILNARDRIPGARYVIPFIRTIANIGKEAIQFSPAGAATVGFRKATGKYANMPAAQMSEDIAKTMIGSAMAIPIVIYARKGDITGAAPKNKNEREAFYRQGKQPYSIRVGDKWISYRRIEPLATVVGLTADLATLKTDKGIEDMAAQVQNIIGQNLLDKSFLSGLSGLLESLTDETKRERWLLNTISGLQPFSATSRFLTQMVDPVVREPKSVVDKIASQIPFASRSVPAKTDLFGQEVTRTLSQRISPIGITQENQDRVEQAMQEIGITPGMPSKKIAGMEISQDEYNKYAKVSGQVTKKVLDQLVASPEWTNLSAREREQQITGAIKDIRDRVRDQLFPLENLVPDIKKNLKDRGYTEEESQDLARKIIERAKQK